MRALLLTLCSLALSACRLQLPPVLDTARAVVYGFQAYGWFTPEANLTISYNLQAECLHVRSVLTFRPDFVTEYSQC